MNSFTKSDVIKAGISEEIWSQWIEKTWIIPSS
jgi:hypothetical protein